MAVETGDAYFDLGAELKSDQAFLTTRRGLLQAGGLAIAAGGSLMAPGLARAATQSAWRSTGQKTIAFSSNFNDIPVIETVKHLITKHAKAAGFKTLFDSGQNGKLSDQIAAVQAWITQGVDAMCILPTQPQALEPYARQALKKGLVWTCYGGSDMKVSDGLVGFSAALSGKQVGEAAVAWINKNAPNAEVLVHTQTNLPVNKPRYQVPIDLIKAHTKATIVATQDADTQDQGLQVTQAVLTAHPNLSVVIGLNDDGALGAAQAFKLAKKDPAHSWISGNDGSLQALQAIKKGGYLKGTAAIPLDQVAAAVVSLSGRLIKHPPASGHKVNANIASIWVTHDSPKLKTLIAAFN